MAKAAKTILVLLILFNLTGFFIIPYLLVNFATLFFSAHPEYSGRISGASFNPYSLRLEIFNIKISEQPKTVSDVRPFFSCDRLLFDLEWASLYHQILMTSEIRLDHPALELIRKPYAAQGQPPLKLPDWFEKSPVISGNLFIREGLVIMEDMESESRHRLEQINLTLPLNSNHPSRADSKSSRARIAPELSMLIDGQPMILKGSSGVPGQTGSDGLNLVFNDFDLTNRLNFLLPRGLRISRGQADFEARLILPEGIDGGASLTLAFQGRLQNLELRDLANDTAVLPAASFTIDLMPLQRSCRIRQLHMERPILTISSTQTGDANAASRIPAIFSNSLQRLIAVGSGLSLDMFEIKDGILDKTDDSETGSPNGHLEFSLQLNDLNRTQGQPGFFNFSLRAPRSIETKGTGTFYLQNNKLGGHLKLDGYIPHESLTTIKSESEYSLKIGDITRLEGDFSLADPPPLPAPLQWAFSRVEIDMTDLKLSSADRWELNLPFANLEGGANLPGGDGWLFSRLNGSNGVVDLESELFMAPPGNDGEKRISSPLKITNIRLADSTIRIRDGNNPGSSPMVLSRISLSGTNIYGSEKNTGEMELEGEIGSGGRISLAGEFSLDPWQGNLALAIDGLSLKAARPFLEPFLPPQLHTAEIKANGHLFFPGLKANGELFMKELNSSNSGEPQSFRCESAIFKDMEVTTRPASLTASELIFIKPTLQVTRLVKKQAAPSSFLFPSASDISRQAGQIRIGTVNISDGNFLLKDLSLDPDLEIGLEGISALMTGMNNQSDQPSPFTLQARLHINPADGNDFEPRPAPALLNLRGTAILFGREMACRGEIKLGSFSLTSLDPWLGELLGYQPLAGQAELAGSFTLAGQKITAKQKLSVTGLALGSSLSGRFNTPLTQALLSDSQDRISLDLEIEGDQQPPYLSYAEGMAKLVRSELAQTTVSPLSLLANLAPDQKELDFIGFTPRSAKFAKGEEDKLRIWTLILQQRPRLALEIRGRTDHSSDRAQVEPSAGQTLNIPIPQASRSDAAGNLAKLTSSRGESVREVLIKAGISPERLRVAPADPDELEEEIILDRPGSRVDLGVVVNRLQ